MQKKESLKVVVIGGGSSYTPELIEGLILHAATLPVKELHLIDVEAGQEKLDIITALTKRMLAKAGSDIRVFSSLDRRSALPGADFVLTQIRVGQMPARTLDEEIPLSFGVLGQETTGVGGMMCGLRTIPVLLDICRDMEELCPDAYLINFANPSGMVTEAILRHSKIKAIGLCNAPLGFKKAAATMLNVDESEVSPEFVGLNHLHWVGSVLHNGKECIDTLLDGRYQSYTAANVSGIGWEDAFIQALRAIPSYYLRYYYMKEEMLNDMLREYAAGEIRSHKVKAIEERLFRMYADPDLKEKPAELAFRGGAYYSEAAIQLLDAIYNDRREIHAVNIQNQGMLPFLDDDASIEINCVIGKDGAIPIKPRCIPKGISGLIRTVKEYETLTIEAAVEGSRSKALLAMGIHPLIPTTSVVPKLLDTMLAANKPYLPNFQ